MLEFKIIAHLASIYLLLFGCLCFTIQRDPVSTEYKVKEFLQKRNKSSFFKPWKLLPTRGYVCSHSHRFLAYLCSVILKQDPYREVIDPDKYQWSVCSKSYIASREGIIGQTESDKIRLYNCPVTYVHEAEAIRYYLSRTHIKSSLFVYKSTDRGFHIYPDAFVYDIHMASILKSFAKSKILKKEREISINQFKPVPPPRPVDLQSLLNQRMILMFSKPSVENGEQFEYLNFQNQNFTYLKFQTHYNKINVCLLRLQQQIYMCKQILDSPLFTFEIDSTYYRKNECRRRRILRDSWQIVKPISTIMCPPTFPGKKQGPEKIYNRNSYFLSSGLEEMSVVVYERFNEEHYIKPTQLVSSFYTDRLAEVLKIERSQPWTKPVSAESDTESQFSLSATSSPDRQSTSSSIFSSSSLDRRSQSTFSSFSSDRSSQSSFYGISSPNRSPPPSSNTANLQRKSSLFSLFYSSPPPNKKSEYKVVDINHDRYVAEEETVELSRFRSIKYPYERYRRTYTMNNICSFKAQIQVQLCKEVLENAEFGYKLITTNTENTSCQQKNIAVNLQDSEDLASNKVPLVRCPNVEAFDTVFYLSTSAKDRSAILLRRLGEFELTYPEAYFLYANEEVLEKKINPKVSPKTSPLRFFYSPPQQRP